NPQPKQPQPRRLLDGFARVCLPFLQYHRRKLTREHGECVLEALECGVALCWRFPMSRSFFLAVVLIGIVSGCQTATVDVGPTPHLRFSPDGKWLAGGGGILRTGAGKGSLKVW